MWLFKKIYLLFFLLYLFTFYACGYKIIGAPISPQGFANKCYIGVSPFVNSTNIPDLEFIVTDATVYELSTWPGVVIKLPDDATYIISGEITRYKSQIPSIYKNREQYPLEYLLSVTLNIYLYNKDDKSRIEILDLTEEESYSVFYATKDAANNSVLTSDENPKEFVNIGASKQSEYKALSAAIEKIIRKAMNDLFIMQQK